MNRRHATIAMATTTLTGTTNAQALPRVASGRIERLADFASRHVAPRHVDVWLPAGYEPSRERHRVIYMHDGQNLFDGSLNFTGKAWRVDAALARLEAAGRAVPAPIVVGIWNHGPERYAEYYPQKVLALTSEPVRREYVEQASNGRSKADAYLRFLVEELKPAIDRRFATRPGREHTFVMGSSMGGLASLYALCEYPQVFAGAGALSAHWIGRPTAWGLARGRNAALPLAMLQYLSEKLPAAGTHRVWIDRGSDELDALYAPALALAGDLLRDRGYGERDGITRVYEGSAHNEASWAQRVEAVLAFLLAP